MGRRCTSFSCGCICTHTGAAAAAAAAAGIRFVQYRVGEERRNLLWQRVAEFAGALHNTPNSLAVNPRPSVHRSAIIPILLGEEGQAVAASSALRAQGIFVPAIRYPTVARGQARLRVTVTATHTHPDIAQLLSALKSLNFGLRTSDFRPSPHAPSG